MSCFRAFTAVACFLALPPLHAAPAGSRLETVTVTATRFEQTDVPFPGSIHVIDAADIKRSGASHLVDALRSEAGLQITDLYGEGSRATVSMRGFGANAQANTLILVDGRRLNNTDLGSPDLNSVSLKDVSRIEVLRGSAGALFGDQAVGGIINIITRKQESFNVDAEAQAGSYGHLGGRISVGDLLASGVEYRFSAEKRRLDNYRDDNKQDYFNLFGSLGYAFASGRVFAEYQISGEDLQTPGALFADQLAADRRQAANPGDFIDTRSSHLRFGIDQHLFSGWRLRGDFTRRESHGDGVLSVGGAGGPVSTDRIHYQATPRLVRVTDTARGRMLMTLGADLDRTDFHLSSILGAIDNTQRRVAVYAQLLYPLVRGVTVTLGARHAAVNNDINGALLPPGTRIGDDINAVEAGVSWQVNQNLRLFARFDSNFRFVLADEYTSASYGGVIPKTQTGRSFEAGLDWQTDILAADITAYRLDLDDEIDFDPLRFINTNIGDTRRRGVAVNGSWQATDKVSLTASFSYVDAGVVAGPLSGLSIPFVADVTAAVGVSWRFNTHLSGHFTVHGMGERTANGDFFNNSGKLPGHTVGDVYLAWRQGPFTLGLKVNNILNNHYSDNAQVGFRAPLFVPETAYFPAPGRNVLLSLQYHND